MAKNVSIPTKVITGVNTRWSYANVWDPKSINGGAPKYSVSLIIPKSDTATVAKIKAAIQAAYEEGQSKLKGNGKSVPALSAIKTPLRDGDLERPDDEAYKNAYFINANSATAPGIVDADRQPILERSVTANLSEASPELRMTSQLWTMRMISSTNQTTKAGGGTSAAACDNLRNEVQINEHYTDCCYHFSGYDRCRRNHRIHNGSHLQKVRCFQGIQEEAHRQPGKDQ